MNVEAGARRSARRIGVAAVGGMIVVALAGCTAHDARPAPSRQVQQTVIALAQSPADLDDARLIAERACLRKHGFDVPFAAPTVTERPTSVVGVVGLMPSASAARASGYGTTIRDEPDPMTSFASGLSPRERQRFELADAGPEDGPRDTVTLSQGAQTSRATTGCAAESFAAVYGSVKTSLSLEGFGNEMLALSDPKSAARVVREKTPAYATCMADAGYQVHGLDAADLALRRFGRYRGPGEAPKAAEAALAETDATCQEQAGLVTATNDLFFSQAAQWIAEHEAQILGWQEDLDAAKERARKIIADA